MSGAPLKVLILGGYGTFGGRLAELLADAEGLEIIVAGRSLAKAEAFCRALQGPVARRPLAFDRNGDVAAQLAACRPDLLVDASGPFQDYGEDPYRVVSACIDAGVDYMDLADASGFVAGVSRFDNQARAAGVSVLAGVSSFPVLTAAVVRDLARGLEQVTAIRGGIAPSPFARVGPNVIRAIASYAGKPFSMLRDGRPARGRGLTETLRYTIRPPGRPPLRPTLFSLVDVPDLQVLPQLWPQARLVWMGAGPRPEILHRGLIALAWLVRLRLLPTLEPLWPLFHWATRTLRWGEHRGGMFVEVQGVAAGGARAVRRSWHMIAEGEDGPLIPSMAAEGLVRRRLSGRVAAAGARPATDELELADYDALFRRRAIFSGRREAPDAGEPEDARPLYRRMLGDAWEALPAALRAIHDVGEGLRATGRAEVERGRGLAANLVADLLGAPAAGKDVPVSVTFTRRGIGETWDRDFGGRRFRSEQAEGCGAWEGLVVERFGPVAVGLAVVAEGEGLRLVVRRWTFLGLPLPLAWAPNGPATETSPEGRFTFDVEIGHPWLGRLVRYRGWLEPVGAGHGG